MHNYSDFVCFLFWKDFLILICLQVHVFNNDTSTHDLFLFLIYGGITNLPLHTPYEKQKSCTLGFLAFKLLGGRFWAISPSSFTNIGSFARASIPATSKYATPSERLAIERLGRATGCHTCGSRMLFTSSPVKFHGDHMPPQAVTKQLNDKWYRKLLGIQVKQRFYPQCVPCSNKQGSILSKATNELRKMEAERNSLNFLKRFGNNLPDLQKAGGGRLAHFHGLRLRTSHLTGGVIGAMTVGSVNGERLPERDLRNGNQKRFRAIQEEIEKKLLSVLAWFDR